jgi:hypothetical protein
VGGNEAPLRATVPEGAGYRGIRSQTGERDTQIFGLREETMKEEVLSNYFYSNCLLEALKAKIKNPKIKVIKRHMTWTRTPHFLWLWKGYTYDFGTNHSIPCKLFFHGYLRRRKTKEEKQ